MADRHKYKRIPVFLSPGPAAKVRVCENLLQKDIKRVDLIDAALDAYIRELSGSLRAPFELEQARKQAALAQEAQKRACPDSNVAAWRSCVYWPLIGSWQEGLDVTSVTSGV